jgi:thymidylate kinase
VVAAALPPDAGGEHHYLGLEEDSGGLVHLHLRYHLEIGDEHLSEYRLPWESLVLSTRRLDRQAGMYVADPSVEFVFLLVRVALDLRLGSRLRHRLGTPWRCPRRLRDVHLGLRGDAGPVADLSRRLLGAAAADLVSDIVAAEPSFTKVWAFRRCLAPVLNGYRLYRRGGAVPWRLARSPRTEGRILPSGGVAIAFLGSDGAGKSTLFKGTLAWLSGSLQGVPIYFGSGDGPSSMLRWPLLQAERLLRRRVPSVRDRPWRRSAGQTSSLRGRLSRALWGVARLVWAVALAYEKRGKLHALTRARNRGLVVICDRYPQNQFQDFNDGPMLGRWRDHRWRLVRALAAWEGTPYRWAEHIVPDLVLKLHVSPSVAQQRKPDMQLPELEKRTEAIRNLRFPGVTETVDIDTEKSLEQVVRQIRRCIWRKL